jgi:hypothetical protein
MKPAEEGRRRRENNDHQCQYKWRGRPIRGRGKELTLIGLIDGSLQIIDLVHELATYVDVGWMKATVTMKTM